MEKEIIDPLLALECDLDKGSCNRIPILSACFREYLPPQDDQCLSVLIEAFIEKTKYVDKSDMRGVTALVTASLHPLVADVIIIDLIKKVRMSMYVLIQAYVIGLLNLYYVI
ncbi:MAG: hypothetical protein HWD59_03215 [Coxiellaceae bacterium]|nr:MAG: hypothetical protein HWD59_03215 [Coxiellaceae bacterium]